MQKSYMKPVWQFLWIVKTLKLSDLTQSFCVLFSNEPYDLSLESCWWSQNASSVRYSLSRHENKARTGREQNRTNYSEEGREKCEGEEGRKEEGREPDTSLCNNKKREDTGGKRLVQSEHHLPLLLGCSLFCCVFFILHLSLHPLLDLCSIFIFLQSVSLLPSSSSSSLPSLVCSSSWDTALSCLLSCKRRFFSLLLALFPGPSSPCHDLEVGKKKDRSTSPTSSLKSCHIDQLELSNHDALLYQVSCNSLQFYVLGEFFDLCIVHSSMHQ